MGGDAGCDNLTVDGLEGGKVHCILLPVVERHVEPAHVVFNHVEEISEQLVCLCRAHLPASLIVGRGG